jgi:hypothetical protein
MHKVLLTGFIVLILSPLRWLDYIKFWKKLKKYKFRKEPLFIIGHWRSGTTLLHNFLCKDSAAGYLTTYQSIFPNNHASEGLLKLLAKIGMPAKRPSDNMDMDMDFPQEEELALGNIHSNFYYNFFYFPYKYGKYYEKAVQMKIPGEEKERWKRAYLILLKKIGIKFRGNLLVIKNPVNTARIKILLEMFPNAKFLFIKRNPYIIIFSTRHFFCKLLPNIWLSRTDKSFIDQMVLDIYLRLMDDYDRQKHLIPPGNLLEIQFEEFEKNPLKVLERIYLEFLKEDYTRVKDTFSHYFKTLNMYEKNKYIVSQEAIDNITLQMQKYIKQWNYSLPEDITIA